jgi:hypothetical protein
VRTLRRIISLSAIAALARAAVAGGGPPTDAYDGIGSDALEVHALADVYYQRDLGDPHAEAVQLRAFDPTANEPALGWLRLRVARRPRTFGFRVDLGLGDTARRYFASDPASTSHPELSRWLSHVGQAFGTVQLAPDLAVDVGKFDTPVGLEDNEALTNWAYSRSFLFTWAEPSLHTGARVTYELSPEIALAGFWLNGWNANVVDGTDMRSYAIAGRWKPTPEVEAVLVYAGGLERAPQPPRDLGFRNLVDAYVTYTPTGWLAFAATGDASARFGGVAGYARVACPERAAAAVRAERFWDPSGFATGTAQTLDEVTATLEARRIVRGAVVIGRLEYRHDHSTASPFEHAGGTASSQDTIAVAIVSSR